MLIMVCRSSLQLKKKCVVEVGPPLTNYFRDLRMQIKNKVAFVRVYTVKGIDYCPIEIIKGLTDKGQFQYLKNLKGPQVGNYLYTTQFLSLR